MGNGGEVFIFDMGEPIRILDLAKKMIRLAGLIPGKDIELRFTGLRPGEKLFEELLNKEEEVIPTHNKKILIANRGGRVSAGAHSYVPAHVMCAPNCFASEACTGDEPREMTHV